MRIVFVVVVVKVERSSIEAIHRNVDEYTTRAIQPTRFVLVVVVVVVLFCIVEMAISAVVVRIEKLNLVSNPHTHKSARCRDFMHPKVS